MSIRNKLRYNPTLSSILLGALLQKQSHFFGINLPTMCGIVAAVADSTILVLVEGLRKLEYRSYGPVVLAVISDDDIERVCAVVSVTESDGSSANTPWATNGVPCKENTDLHFSNCISVVNNCIIESCESLHHVYHYRRRLSTTQQGTNGQVVGYLPQTARRLCRLRIKQLKIKPGLSSRFSLQRFDYCRKHMHWIALTVLRRWSIVGGLLMTPIRVEAYDDTQSKFTGRLPDDIVHRIGSVYRDLLKPCRVAVGSDGHPISGPLKRSLTESQRHGGLHIRNKTGRYQGHQIRQQVSEPASRLCGSFKYSVIESCCINLSARIVCES